MTLNLLLHTMIQGRERIEMTRPICGLPWEVTAPNFWRGPKGSFTKSDTSTFVNIARFVVLTIVDMAKPVMISTGREPSRYFVWVYRYSARYCTRDLKSYNAFPLQSRLKLGRCRISAIRRRGHWHTAGRVQSTRTPHQFSRSLDRSATCIVHICITVFGRTIH